MKKSKRLIIAAVVVLLTIVVARLYYNLTDDFRLANMIYEMPYNPSWDVTSLHTEDDQKIDQILSQEFSYIGKGAQSYAFESQDRQYVLKFFKFKHLKPFWLMELLPDVPPFKGYKERLAIRKHRKLIGVFDGYRVAYEMHKPESALIYVQLNIQNNPKRSVHVRDKIGLQKEIDLQPIVFVLQKKGETLRTVMHDLLKNGELETAKTKIGQIFDLYAGEYQKGIYDRDHGVMHNTGFTGDVPFHLDLGKMTRDDSVKNTQVARNDLQLIVNKITIWVHSNYPQYDSEIQQYMNDKISRLF